MFDFNYTQLSIQKAAMLKTGEKPIFEFIPIIRNNFAFQLRESCQISTIVNGIVLNQYNAIYDRENYAL